MNDSLIVEAAENGVIGNAGQLPWRLPDDLRRFRQITSGHTVLMGRKTADSIGKPLPNRTNLVLSRRFVSEDGGWVWVKSWEDAVSRVADDGELVVIGGAEVYRLALPVADTIYLTRVAAKPAGDVLLPELGEGWSVAASEFHPTDDRHAFAFSFLVLKR